MIRLLVLLGKSIEAGDRLLDFCQENKRRFGDGKHSISIKLVAPSPSTYIESDNASVVDHLRLELKYLEKNRKHQFTWGNIRGTHK